jgi:hypothetical protein
MTIYVGGKALAVGGHTQNTDTGTDSSTFQLDNDATGVKIKNNSGVLEIKNAADDTYANLKGLVSNVGNIQTSGNTISSTDTNGNILVTPNGTGKTIVSGLVENGSVNVQSLSADKTLVNTDIRYHSLNPNNANRIVNLPTVDVVTGKIFTILNTGTAGNSLTIKEGATSLQVIWPAGICSIYYTGTHWEALDPFSNGYSNQNYKHILFGGGNTASGLNNLNLIDITTSYTKSVTLSNRSISLTTSGGSGNIGTDSLIIGNNQSRPGNTDGTIEIGTNTNTGKSNSINITSASEANTATSSINDGHGNYVNGQYSVGIGSDIYLNEAIGAIAFGRSQKLNKEYQQAIGGYATSPTRYAESKVNTGADSTGKYSRSTLSWYKSTANATPVEIFLDNSAERATIQASSSMTYSILVTARDNVGNKVAGWEFKGVIKRDASNNTVLVNDNKTILALETVTWDCAVTADDTNEALKITVTGDGTNPVQWNAIAQVSETHF